MSASVCTWNSGTVALDSDMRRAISCWTRVRSCVVCPLPGGRFVPESGTYLRIVS